MLGFELVRTDWTTIRLESTHYVVTDDGSLVVFADDNEVFRATSDEWIDIRELGTRLAATWPPDDLEFLLDNLYTKLGLGYGHTTPGGLGPVSAYGSGLLNELETLTTAVLERVGLDASASNRRREADAVRDIIRRHFHLRGAPGRP